MDIWLNLSLYLSVCIKFQCVATWALHDVCIAQVVPVYPLLGHCCRVIGSTNWAHLVLLLLGSLAVQRKVIAGQVA